MDRQSFGTLGRGKAVFTTGEQALASLSFKGMPGCRPAESVK